MRHAVLVVVTLLAVPRGLAQSAGSGGLEGVLSRCCQLGSDWGRQRSYASCLDFPAPVASVRSEHLAVCIASADICCRRDNRNIQCRRGTTAALADKSCVVNTAETGESYKDCCEACKLGMISGSLGETCRFARFSFGLPWDEAFHECCAQAVVPSRAAASPAAGPANNELSPSGPTNQSLCDALQGQLCAHVCVPTPGSFRCECHPGFALMSDGKSCTLLHQPDRCAKNNPCMHTCRDTGLAVECACRPGYELQSDRKSCKDIDECQRGTHLCRFKTQTCRNDPGGYTCLGSDGTIVVPPANSSLLLDNDVVGQRSGGKDCPLGYQFNHQSLVCDDLDECALGVADCVLPADCVNTIGSYRCDARGARGAQHAACPPGYIWSDVSQSCADVDECENGSHHCDEDTQFCLNSQGGHACLERAQGRGSCPAGYKKDATRRSGCADVDECADPQMHICSNATEMCINEPGGYRCVKSDAAASPASPASPTSTTSTTTTPTAAARCEAGYTYSFHSGKCVDHDECQDNPCDSSQRCHNTVGSYSCECRTGFARDPVTQACVDINECQLGISNCVATQRCDNTIGSFQCIRFSGCGTGYTLNAATGNCEDDDECLLGTDNCAKSGPTWVCRNTQGSFRCERKQCDPGSVLLDSGECLATPCEPGFEPAASTAAAGPECVDVDECARGVACGRGQRCVNTPGSYQCVYRIQCRPGFAPSAEGDRCVDEDECALGTHECKPGQTCLNRAGHYQCQCPAGHTLDDAKNCVDVDECERFPRQVCSNLATCENTIGSYRCICKEGFKQGRGKNCDDIDECAETPNLCQQQCVNVWGSYRCTCERGFYLHSDNRTCVDVDECQVHKERRLCVGDCVNTPGSYSCTCPPGYRLGKDGRLCHDIDECATGRECRGPGEVCLNMQGSFRCNTIRCPDGYESDPTMKNRCRRVSRSCPPGDQECHRQPVLMTYNFMALVSNMTIPASGQLDLFVMRGPPAADTLTTFSLALQGARSPSSAAAPPATRSYFRLTQVRGNQAVVSLVRPLLGPQDVELHLSMEVYSGSYFAGLNVARLYLFVSQHEF